MGNRFIFASFCYGLIGIGLVAMLWVQNVSAAEHPNVIVFCTDDQGCV